MIRNIQPTGGEVHYKKHTQKTHREEPNVKRCWSKNHIYDIRTEGRRSLLARGQGQGRKELGKSGTAHPKLG